MLSYPHTRRFQVLCSALAVLKDIDELHVDHVFADTSEKVRVRNWQWLTFALFSKSSTTTISSLTLEDRWLCVTDMETIVGILDMLYPVRKLMDRDSLHEYFLIDMTEKDRELRRQCARDSWRYEMGSAYGSNVDYGDSDNDEDDFDDDSHGDYDDGESGDDEDEDDHQSDPFAEAITESSNDEAYLAGAEYAHLFFKKSEEQDVYQRAPSPWYGIDDKDEVTYPKRPPR